LHIVEKVCTFDPWFIQRHDGVGRLGLLFLQKCTAVLRMLAYSVAAGTTDEYCRMGESTGVEAMKHFTVAIRGSFQRHSYASQVRRIYKSRFKSTLREGFQVCLAISIAYTGFGRTVPLLGKDSSRTRMVPAISSWKPSQTNPYGFGTRILDCLVAIMT
jgi:hypothetical protein